MKTRQLRAFLEEFVVAKGGSCEGRGDNLLALSLPPEAAETVGQRDLVFAFNLRGLQEHSRSELATVGNPLFERMLDWARQVGRIGVRFLPVPRRTPVPNPAGHFHVTAGSIEEEPFPTYTPLYFFLFRTEYSLEDHADDLEVVPLDGISWQPLAQTPELIDYWSDLKPEPAAGRSPEPSFPLSDGLLRAALDILERRLRKRLGRLRRDCEDQRARETDSIGAYYQQLIAEARNAGRRWTLSAAQREERIRLLQLDWKRRTEEAQQHWRPRVDVRLVAAAAAMRPRLAWPVRPTDPKRPRNRRKQASFLYWDETDRGFVDPPCARCGTLAPPEITPADGSFLCRRCGGQDGTDKKEGRSA